MAILASPLDLPATAKWATVYYGPVKALRAEVSLHPCYTGAKYAVAAFGPNGEEYTPELIDTKAGARAMAKDYARMLDEQGHDVVISHIA